MTTVRKSWRRIFVVSAALSLTAIHASTADNPDQVAQFKQTHVCPACDLTGAALGGIQARGAKLAGANLSDAVLYGANLRDADLTGAILARADLKMADLTGAIGAALGDASTDNRTTCPDGTAGPCK